MQPNPWFCAVRLKGTRVVYEIARGTIFKRAAQIPDRASGTTVKRGPPLSDRENGALGNGPLRRRLTSRCPLGKIEPCLRTIKSRRLTYRSSPRPARTAGDPSTESKPRPRWFLQSLQQHVPRRRGPALEMYRMRHQAQIRATGSRMKPKENSLCCSHCYTVTEHAFCHVSRRCKLEFSAVGPVHQRFTSGVLRQKVNRGIPQCGSEPHVCWS